MSALPMAHAGHWAASLLVFLGPLVLIVLWIAYSSRRKRRRAEDRIEPVDEETGTDS